MTQLQFLFICYMLTFIAYSVQKEHEVFGKVLFGITCFVYIFLIIIELF